MANADKIREMEEAVADLKRRLDEEINQGMEEGMGKDWQELKSKLIEKKKQAMEKAKQSDQNLRGYAMGHPYQVIGISMLAGLVVGMLISNQKRMEK